MSVYLSFSLLHSMIFLLIQSFLFSFLFLSLYFFLFFLFLSPNYFPTNSICLLFFLINYSQSLITQSTFQADDFFRLLIPNYPLKHFSGFNSISNQRPSSNPHNLILQKPLSPFLQPKKSKFSIYNLQLHKPIIKEIIIIINVTIIDCVLFLMF